jgi:hypothetical protein
MSGSPLDDVDFDAAFDKEAWIQSKQRVHEDRVVKYVLKEIGKPGLIPQLRRRGKELSDSPLLHFGLFYEAVPDFPVWIGSRHVPFVFRDLTLANVQRRFTKIRIWEAFIDVKSEAPNGWDGPVGVIFRSAKIHSAYGSMVLHDGPSMVGDFWLQKRLRDRVYTIETLVDFLARLRTNDE